MNSWLLAVARLYNSFPTNDLLNKLFLCSLSSLYDSFHSASIKHTSVLMFRDAVIEDTSEFYNLFILQELFFSWLIYENNQ